MTDDARTLHVQILLELPEDQARELLAEIRDHAERDATDGHRDSGFVMVPSEAIGYACLVDHPGAAPGPSTEMTTPETWYVHQDDDDLGGWCVLSVDRPPGTLTGEDVDAGRRLVADFANEADARRIAELHNAAAAGRLLPDGGETRTQWGVRSRAGEVSPAFDESDACDLAARRAAVGRPAKVVWQPLWIGPWVAVDPEVIGG